MEMYKRVTMGLPISLVIYVSNLWSFYFNFIKKKHEYQLIHIVLNERL